MTDSFDNKEKKYSVEDDSCKNADPQQELAASILGLGYFPTGYATGFSMFRYLAAGWWIAAVVMYLFPGLYTILFFAALLIVLQVIPGYIVYRRCQRDVLNTVPITL